LTEEPHLLIGKMLVGLSYILTFKRGEIMKTISTLVSVFVLAAMCFVFIAQDANAGISIKESSSPSECNRKLLNARDCGRWYRLQKIGKHMNHIKPGIEDSPIWNTAKETIVAPRKIVLRGIKFDTAKATIKSESLPILRKNLAELKSNPNVKITVIGHTDSDGSVDFNQTLSQQRARAVLNYLVEHGIDVNRLNSRGVGESRPVATNNTVEGKALNRRIEILMN